MSNQEPKKSVFNRLNKIFSSGGLIIRHSGGKKLKSVDLGNLQSFGNRNLQLDRFSKLYTNSNLVAGSGYGTSGLGSTAGGFSAYGSQGYQQQNIEFQRNKIYLDYELMDKDPIINSAMDILADETCVKNEYNEILTIRTKNSDVKEILESLFFDILNINYNLRPWARNLIKYGDFYLKLDLMEEYGVVNAYPLSPYFMYRLDGMDPNNPYDVKFEYEIGNGYKEKYNYSEIAHFRMLGDVNFLPYGKSFMENGRFIFKQIYLMEEAMLIHRIMRAPEKRVFKVDVGNIPPDEIQMYMNQVINRAKRTPIMDPDTGEYNLKYNMQNLLEDYYIPVRGSNSGAEIDSLPGLSYDAVEDINYLLNKLFASLKVPKTYLSYEEEISGKSTLAAEDVRFAKTIEGIQKIIISELTKIAVIHLFMQGFKGDEILDFQIELANPSTIFEKEKIELLSQKANLARDLIENNLMSREKIFKKIFNYTDDEIVEEEDKIISDLKLGFRFQQITDEGNDPLKTGQSFGTAHDIASMHVRTKNEIGAPEGGQPGAGRPKSGDSNYGTDSSTFGRDPVGSKDLFKSLSRDQGLKHNFRKSPLSFESDRKKKAIIESFSKKEVIDEDDIFKGTFLDETILENILKK